MKKIMFQYALLSLLAACQPAGKEQETEETESATTPAELRISLDKQKLIGISCVPLLKQTQSSSFEASGKVVILSQYRETVTGKINGMVEKILVLEGQKVQKGQALLELSSSELIELQENYLNAKSEMSFLKMDYERQKTLKDANVNALKDFQLSESKYQACVGRIKSAEARLRYIGLNPAQVNLDEKQPLQSSFIIRANIDGYVLKLPVSMSMGISPGMELAHIVNIDKYHADLFVYEKDIDQVKEGQEVSLSFTNRSIPLQKGRVEFISRGIDPETRTIIVHVVLDKPHPNILPDMTIRGNLHTSGAEVQTLPSSALMHSGAKFFVYYCAGEQAELFKKGEVKVLTDDEETCAVEPLFDFDTKTRFVVKGSMLLDLESKKGEMEDE